MLSEGLSKQYIKDLFTNEILNSEEYQTVLKIKNAIINEIQTPSIVEKFIYNFETPQTENQRNIIKLAMIIEFGFYSNDMNENTIIIDMKNFLEN